MKTAVERFEERYIPEPNSGCWLWTGTLFRLGYGQMHYEGKNRSAHRISYMLHKGTIPDGFEVQHSCDVRCCVNPDHLSLATHVENMRASSIRGRYPNRSGTNNCASKLTPDEVRAIRTAVFLKRGDQAKLARQYKVSKKLIQLIRANKAWDEAQIELRKLTDVQ